MLGDVVAQSPHVTAVKAEAPPTPVAVAELTARCTVPVFGGLGGVGLLDELAVGAAGAMTGFSFPEGLLACVRSGVGPGEPETARAEAFRPPATGHVRAAGRHRARRSARSACADGG